MKLELLLDEAERNPEDRTLVASLLIQSAQDGLETLPEEQQARLYNLLAYIFANNLAGNSYSALQTALQRALTQPPVLEYFQQRMEQSIDFGEMLKNHAATPIILALLCAHDDEDIARQAAIALAYTGNEVAYNMLQRWLTEGNKRLVRAAEVALPYFAELWGERDSQTNP